MVLALALCAPSVFAQEPKESGKTLNCIRRVLHQKSDAAQRVGTFWMNELRKSLRSDSNDESALVQGCRVDLKALRKNQNDDRSYPDVATYDGVVRGITQNFIKPTFNCNDVSIGADAGLLLELGASLVSGVCTGSDGSRWLDLGGSAKLGFGIGASVHVAHNADDFGSDVTVWFATGVGVYTEGGTIGNREEVGYTAGLGIGEGTNHGGTIRLLPLSPNNSKIIQELLE